MVVEIKETEETVRITVEGEQITTAHINMLDKMADEELATKEKFVVDGYWTKIMDQYE